MDDKKKMLAAMLAGQPTKESEAIRMISEKTENPKAVTSYLQEQKNIDALPSANNLQISKAEVMMGGVKGLPPVSEEDLSYFFGDKKGQKPKRSTSQPIQETNNYYDLPQITQVITEDKDRFDDIDLLAELNKQKRINNNQGIKPLNEQLLPNQSLTPDLKKIVESYVYEILSEIIDDANQNLVNKEQIKIQIGESLFVGKLQKALAMPKKK